MLKKVLRSKLTKAAPFLFLGLWIVFAFYYFMQNSNVKKEFFQEINIAGKQRMLTQQIMVCAYKFHATEDVLVQPKLASLREEMHTNAMFLHENSFAHNKELRYVLSDVEYYLEVVKSFIDLPNQENLDALDNQSVYMLEIAMQTVEVMKENFSKQQDQLAYLNMAFVFISIFIAFVFMYYVFLPAAKFAIDNDEKLQYISSILSISDEAQIIIDDSGKIVDFNTNAAIVFEKLKNNMTIGELLEEEEEEEEELCHIFNMTKLEEYHDYVFKYNKKHYKMHYKRFEDALFMISFFDITHEIKENRRKGVIYNSQKSIVVVTDGECIKNINSIFFEEFGFENLEDFKEQHKCICELFVSKEGSHYITPSMDGLAWNKYMEKHRNEVHEVLMIDKNGKEKIYEVKSSGNYFAEEEEEEEEAVIIFNDITELKEKNNLLLLQSKDAAIGEMISMIAHQWRQPLTILSAILSRVRVQKEMDMLDDIALNAAIEKSNAQIIYMSKTIDDFRDFFKDTDKKEKVALHEIIEVPKNLINTLLHSKNISFEVEYKDIDAQMYIETISSKLSQVFLNIYKNAIDQITLKEVEEGSIKVSIFFEKKYLCIEICDNAGGIDEKAMKRLFEPYFSTKSKNGTGLGLYMSKKIVQEILGGNISALNKNGGACFKILLEVEA